MTNDADTVDLTPLHAWLDRFNAAWRTGEAGALENVLLPDSHWRDALALTWSLRTVSGARNVAGQLARFSREQTAGPLTVHPSRCPPRRLGRAGVTVIEAILSFRTRTGDCAAVVKIPVDQPVGNVRAWALMTALEQIDGHPERRLIPDDPKDAYARDFHGKNWLDRRNDHAQYRDTDPTVLVVGGGHAGLTAAARLGQLGIDTLVVDPMQRIGDNWRLRYHSLHLHNRTPVNHLPYMPFPDTFEAYLPKDKVANWLEMYAEAMEINFWTQTRLTAARYDTASKRWHATVQSTDGKQRELKPRHIVMATSVSGTARMPDIPTLDAFAGQVLHSSQYKNGAQWRDQPVMVFGTGTSAHDVAQDLHGHGARVTLVQRSPTLVVNVEPSAQLYEEIYLGDGPSLDDRDLLNVSMPLPIIEQAHKRVTDRVREIDKPMLDGLAAAGFELEFGRDGTGWPLKFRERGGGYYFNIGCSELIINGDIDLIQYRDIDCFTRQGVRMADGSQREAALAVLATGYHGQEFVVRELFGEPVAQRVGKIWGFDKETAEMNNMWVRTAQPGLWFTSGAFSQGRVYSRYLALQILGDELGITTA